jgi:serine/threonine-protein kinase
VRVPAFKGRLYAEAQRLAERSHLELRISAHRTNAARRGTVLTQSVAPSIVVASGSTITVVLSLGPPKCCTVPALEDLTLEDAESALAAAGLSIGTVSFRETDAPTGTVIDQDPASGVFLSRGDKVAIVVDAAPEPPKRKGKGHD